MITVYTIAYNEEVMLPFFIKWYRTRFPDCKIVIYDNYSTDNTEKIALENNCEVRKHDSNGKIRDDLYLQVKNNCWKNADTDWVLICDVDEFLNINKEKLLEEEEVETTVILSEGWNMINMVEGVVGMNYEFGKVSAPQYSKNCLFNKKFIKEVNYNGGCHTNTFIGKVKTSQSKYDLFHYKWIGEDYTIKRYREFVLRMSQENIKRKEAFHYFSTEKQIKEQYKHLREIVKSGSNKQFNWLIE